MYSRVNVLLALLFVFIITFIAVDIILYKQNSRQKPLIDTPLTLKDTVKKDQETYLPVPTPTSRSCLTFTDPTRKFTLERINHIGDRTDAQDYIYTGTVKTVKRVTEKTPIKECTYIVIQIANRVKKVDEIKIPNYLSAQTQYGTVYPTLYTQYLNRRVSIRIRFDTTSSRNNRYEIIEWQPYVFYAN